MPEKGSVSPTKGMKFVSASALSGRLSISDLAQLRAMLLWRKARKSYQTQPKGDWYIWLMLAGRGAGKTRTAAETLRDWAWEHPETQWLVSAPTYGDLDGVCFNGPKSGLLAVIPPEMIKSFNKTELELVLMNGSKIKGISAEKPDRFRGWQFHGGWLDELGAWQRQKEAWDLLMMTMRLGVSPKIICTTTPKPTPVIRDLVSREGTDVVITRASTYDNKDNLAPNLFKEITQYEGTLWGRQEIEGELLDPAEMGIVKRSWIQPWGPDQELPYFDFIVVSLDTALTEETRDKKTHEPDFTACTVWGLFRDNDGQYGILLLDAWQDRIGMPDLVEKAKQELRARYGEHEEVMIKPLVGPAKVQGRGQTPNLLIIEDKGSGISLRQMLAREGIAAWPYNPGRAKKVDRLHAVSHLFAHGMIWMPQSAKNYERRKSDPNAQVEFVGWADAKGGLIEQLTTFTGEGSTPFDDFVDSTTQALRYLADKIRLSVTEPMDEEEDVREPVVNPYAQ